MVFAVIDRVSVKSPCISDWDPRKLPKVKIETPTKRRYNAVCGIVVGIFGLLWLLAIPEYPFLIIGPAAYAGKSRAGLADRLLAVDGARRSPESSNTSCACCGRISPGFRQLSALATSCYDAYGSSTSCCTRGRMCCQWISTRRRAAASHQHVCILISVAVLAVSA